MQALSHLERRATCFHEAGHAVVFALGGVAVSRVAVAPEGATEWRTPSSNGRSCSDLWGLCVKAELVLPRQLLRWLMSEGALSPDGSGYARVLESAEGRAIVGTGSPFQPYEYEGKMHYFAQTNNSYIFPGVGLATLAVSARRVSDGMFLAASKALAELSPAKTVEGAKLLPPLNEMLNISRYIAIAVAKQARAEGLTEHLSDQQIETLIEAKIWRPEYRPYQYVGGSGRR